MNDTVIQDSNQIVSGCISDTELIKILSLGYRCVDLRVSRNSASKMSKDLGCIKIHNLIQYLSVSIIHIIDTLVQDNLIVVDTYN